MQEGYKESKTGVGSHFSSPPAFSLLLFPLSLALYVFSFVYTLSLFHISPVCRLFFPEPRAIKHSHTLTHEIIRALQHLRTGR